MIKIILKNLKLENIINEATREYKDLKRVTSKSGYSWKKIIIYFINEDYNREKKEQNNSALREIESEK